MSIWQARAMGSVLNGARQGMKRHWHLPLIVCVALGLRLAWLAVFMRDQPIEPHGMDYARIAADLLHRKPDAAMMTHESSVGVPSILPLFIALVSYVLPVSVSIAGAARLASLVCGALIVVPVYQIAWTMYGRRTAVIAAWCVAVHPVMVNASTTVAPEPAAVLTLLAGVACIVASWQRSSVALSAAAGGLFGLTALVSVHALPCAAAAAIGILIVPWASWRKRASRLLVFAASLSICVAAILAWLGVAAPAIAFDGAPAELLREFDARRIVSQLRAAFASGAILGLPLAAALALAALLGRRSAGVRVPAIHLLLALVLLASMLALGGYWPLARFAVFLISVGAIWSAAGIVHVGERLEAALPARAGSRILPIAAVTVVCTVAALSLRALTEEGRSTPSVWETGWWLATVGPADKRVMDTSHMLAFHAGATFVSFPAGEPEAALQAIADQNIDYLVVRSAGEPRPAYLHDWHNRGVPDARARLVHSAAGPRGQRVAIYQWQSHQRRGEAAAIAPASLVQTGASDRETARGPLRPGAENPRYFSDPSGKAVYLTGSHTWDSFQDAARFGQARAFDFERYLAFVETHGFNFIRLWTWEQGNWAPWRPHDFRFAPLPYTREGPGLARDGQPRFNLARFNPAYFRRLRERVAAAGARGIYVSVMLFQGWSVDRKHQNWANPWDGHPFHRDNNTNGVDGDPDGRGSGEAVHSLRDPGILALQKAYVEQVVESVNDLDNVLYEICNECGGAPSVRWQYHMIEFLRGVEARRPKQHPIGMTVVWPDGTNADLMNSPADWISPSGADGYGTEPPVADGTKVIVADTDHIWGIGGSADWVWKSFLRGLNPIFMDPYDLGFYPGTPLLHGLNERTNARWKEVRRQMSYTAAFAARLDLASMRPLPGLSSSGYCLARLAGLNSEYLAYSASGNPVTLDLSAAPGELTASWFSPASGYETAPQDVRGGAMRTFRPPSGTHLVLHIRPQEEPRARRQSSGVADGRGDDDQRDLAEATGLAIEDGAGS